MYQHTKNKLLKQIESSETIDDIKRVMIDLIKTLPTRGFVDDVMQNKPDPNSFTYRTEKARKLFGNR
jgi:hypothetical protein